MDVTRRQLSLFLAASPVWPTLFHVPLLAQAQEATAQPDYDVPICATPQFSEYDKIISLGTAPIPFSYRGDRQLTLNPLIGAGEVITFEQFQLALGPDAWTRSEGLPGSTSQSKKIGVYFLDGSEQQRATVRKYAPSWTSANGVPVQFIFDNKDRNHIRITFIGDGNWSRIGRQAAYITDKNTPTMSLLDVRPGISETRMRRVILHEFGHALGLRHEHHHPESGIIWDEEVVYREMEELGWTREKTKYNIIDGLTVSYKCRGAEAFDPSSIMLYPIPRRWTKNGFFSGDNSELSAADLGCVQSIYI